VSSAPGNGGPADGGPASCASSSQAHAGAAHPRRARWEGRSAATWARRLSVATVEFHARIGSTNDRARALMREESPAPALVVADRQSAGKGRRGRHWHSDTSSGLWFTVVRSAAEGGAEVLPLRAGLAAARGIEAAVPGLSIALKWPNDLFANGRKLGGVLCERAGEWVLVGIGLNLNQRRDELPSGLTPPATSVALETGHAATRGRVLAAVMDALHPVWSRPGPPIPPDELAELQSRSLLNGRSLSVDGVVRHSSHGPRTVEGLSATAVRLCSDGSLEVRVDAGTRLRVVAGSVVLK